MCEGMSCDAGRMLSVLAPGRQTSEMDSLWGRNCGCVRTSTKLKQILKKFPSPPPPSILSLKDRVSKEHICISSYCTHNNPSCKPIGYKYKDCESTLPKIYEPPNVKAESSEKVNIGNAGQPASGQRWSLMLELVQIVQLSVTATALALYYLIYCYMQLVYYTLRSAVFFHNADGPMKVTIGVVTVTSLIVGFNLILKLEKLVGLFR